MLVEPPDRSVESPYDPAFGVTLQTREEGYDVSTDV